MIQKESLPLYQISPTMTFDCITQDKNLWAVRCDGDSDNILYRLFDRGMTSNGCAHSSRNISMTLSAILRWQASTKRFLTPWKTVIRWNASCWTSARTTTWMHFLSRLKISAHRKCCLARRKPVLGAKSGIRPGFAFMPSNWIRVCISHHGRCYQTHLPYGRKGTYTAWIT